MADRKWTPGPWRIASWSLCMITASDDEHLVATVEGFHQTRQLRAQAEANARLIAAAPELYAALNLILNGDVAHAVTDPAHIDFNDAVKMGRAALAKARGEG